MTAQHISVLALPILDAQLLLLGIIIGTVIIGYLLSSFLWGAVVTPQCQSFRPHRSVSDTAAR